MGSTVTFHHLQSSFFSVAWLPTSQQTHSSEYHSVKTQNSIHYYNSRLYSPCLSKLKSFSMSWLCLASYNAHFHTQVLRVMPLGLLSSQPIIKLYPTKNFCQTWSALAPGFRSYTRFQEETVFVRLIGLRSTWRLWILWFKLSSQSIFLSSVHISSRGQSLWLPLFWFLFPNKSRSPLCIG